MLICGIDEAGRGPVLGPLVMAGVMIRKEDSVRLKELGVKDSKLLTKEKREELFDKIKKIAEKFEIVSVSPSEVDAALSSVSLNLNWLEAQVSAKIVNKLDPDKVILDCPSVNVLAYEEYFKRQLVNSVRSNVSLIVEHKADLNYVVVGAASILAKVTRDRFIEESKKKLRVDFGSGYMSDEKTQVFLKENFNNKEYSELFRKKWASYKELVDEKNQSKLTGF